MRPGGRGQASWNLHESRPSRAALGHSAARAAVPKGVAARAAVLTEVGEEAEEAVEQALGKGMENVTTGTIAGNEPDVMAEAARLNRAG